VDAPELDPDDLPDGVVVADATGVVILVNRAAARIAGIDAVGALGAKLSDVLPLTDTDGRRWWGCMDPVRSLRTVTGHGERSLTLPGGREVYVTARYVRDGDRGPVRRVVVGLRDTRAREREEMSRAELVSSVAHELRSPLTSVKGFTATLLAKWDRFTDAQKLLMLETVEADADRVTRLVTELLDIGRIDSGRLQIRRVPVDLPAIVSRHVRALVAAGQDESRFVVRVEPGLGELWVDADKLDQILGNVLDNAVRHGAGTVTALIEPAAWPGPGAPGTAVTVTDEGQGVPDAVASRVFTKFWRSGTRDGTGLGLYIVRGLVQAHGGAVLLGRSESGGALFRFTLPAGVPDLAGIAG
jgi:signal transduction histidine kinase